MTYDPIANNISDPTALERLKAHTKAELAAGRQITWTAGFAVSRPTLKQLKEWFDIPADLKKAEAVEWLAEQALKEAGLQ